MRWKKGTLVSMGLGLVLVGCAAGEGPRSGDDVYRDVEQQLADAADAQADLLDCHDAFVECIDGGAGDIDGCTDELEACIGGELPEVPDVPDLPDVPDIPDLPDLPDLEDFGVDCLDGLWDCLDGGGDPGDCEAEAEACVDDEVDAACSEAYDWCVDAGAPPFVCDAIQGECG